MVAGWEGDPDAELPLPVQVGLDQALTVVDAAALARFEHLTAGPDVTELAALLEPVPVEGLTLPRWAAALLTGQASAASRPDPGPAVSRTSQAPSAWPGRAVAAGVG